MKKRRMFILVIASAFFYMGCNTGDPGDKPAEHPVMFMGDAMHHAETNSMAITKTPAVKWKFKSNGPVINSCVIDNNRLLFGSNDSNLYCLNKETGAQYWRYKTNGAICSTPAVAGNTVYFISYDGVFYALNKNDGSLTWSFKTEGERRFAAKGIHGAQPKDSLIKDDWDFFLSSPAIEGDLVCFGTGSGYIYALNTETGKEVWKFKTNEVTHCSPAIAYGNVYIGSWDTYLYVLDLKTGRERWKFKTGEDTVIHNQTGIQNPPVIYDSVLYFGCRDSHIYALDAITGRKLFERFEDYSWVNSPVVRENKVLYTLGDGSSLIALNRNNYDSVFQTSVKGWVMSPPAISGSTAYFGDINGFLNAIDINTGKEVWIYQTEASKEDIYQILNTDSTLDFKVFSKEKKVKENKSSMQMIYSLGAILAPPVIDNGNIYFGSTDGYVYCLK